MVKLLTGLLVSTVSGTVLAALLFLVKPLVKNRVPQKIQYFSWYLVFIRMLLPITLGGFFIGSLIPPLQNLAIENPVNATSTVASPPESSAANSAADTMNLPQAADSPVTPPGSNFSVYDLMPLLLTVWLMGIIVVLGLNITGYLRFSSRIKESRIPLDDQEALALFQECCGKYGLKGPLPLYVSSCIDTPMLCGLVKCSIVLPERSFTPEQLCHAFLHELIHHRRHDNLLKWISVLAVSVNWFNPVVYFAAREAGRKCELSCDETVTAGFTKEECVRYGETLLAVASNTDYRPFAMSATMSEDKRNLKERLEFLVKAKRKSRCSEFISVVLLGIGIAAMTFTLMVSGIEKPIVLAEGAELSVNILGFDENQPEESVPVQLPPASQYPKPAFDGTVTMVSPAWKEMSVVPEDSLHIDPDNLQSPPVKDFTITQCWKGSLKGEDFVLETYYDFSEKDIDQSEYCYAALKTGGKVYLTPIDPQEILVSFCGPMAVFIRPAMSYTVMPIDLQSGSFVAADSDEIRSLATESSFDSNEPPSIPSYVTGITQKVAAYPACQTSASMSNPFNDPKDTAALSEAWKQRIGNR